MGHETAGGSIVHTAEAVRQEVRTGVFFCSRRPSSGTKITTSERMTMTQSVCCSHQSQAAWTFFPPVETKAFNLVEQRVREQEESGWIQATSHNQ